MKRRSIVHTPGPKSKAKPYTYSEITFDSVKEAWRHFDLGINDVRGQLLFLSKEATRRERERANANVNAPNAPKDPTVKLLNNAVRVVNAPRDLVTRAQAGDIAAQSAIISQYREVLRGLEESPHMAA